MCNFASAVLTKDKVFWSDQTDSHSALIDMFKLHEDGARGPNIVKVEIVPTSIAMPVSRWRFIVDQDKIPDWFDRERDEKRARKALRERLAQPHWKNFIDLFQQVKKFEISKADGAPEPHWKVFAAETWDEAKSLARKAMSQDPALGRVMTRLRDVLWVKMVDRLKQMRLGSVRDLAWTLKVWGWERPWAGAEIYGDIYPSIVELYAMYVAVKGRMRASEQAAQIESIWRVWQKGYALAGEVKGTFYVYTVNKSTPRKLARKQPPK